MKRNIEGPADTGQPADEGGKVRPNEDPRHRNTTGEFPGEANEGPNPGETDPEFEQLQAERESAKKQRREEL